ncbi:MAG: hypothetical protein IJT70_07220 [Clostridia bacterium]|nr:hypothetical protein [Clostridia bacterium]
MDNEQTTKRSGRLTALRIILLALLLAVYSAMPVYAWLVRGRRAAGVVEIDDPTSIYINAANKEDIRYLYMSGIDLESTSTTHPTQANKKYKDFVFCVRGIADAYKLQLAYTTNNQFEFELFHATKATGAVPEGAVAVVDYETHPDRIAQQYYAAPGVRAITGHFLNRQTETEANGKILAYTNDTYEQRTYGTYGDTAGRVNEYAYPIYWQADDAIHTTPDQNGEFCDYYILRVIWENTRRNDKETDIIYITARNITTN